MSDRENQSSLTERSYWDEVWASTTMPRLVDPSDRSLGNHGNLVLHDFFSAVLRDAAPAGGRLIEIGCAQSKWLPYFAKVHGMAVTGMDYSELGCARARALVHSAGCEGEIVKADMFNPPDELRSRFDVVLSMGLIEHFPDTASAVRACAELAKPGGIVVTLVPNMGGAIGIGQRWLDRDVYRKHVVLGREALRGAHERCDLTILRSEYVSSPNFGVINHSNLKPALLNKAIRGLLLAVTAGFWTAERAGISIPAAAFLSPYVACVAAKSAPATAR